VPTYDYRCRDCGHTIEIVHSILEDGPEACERCRGPVERVLQPTGVIFRGSGFYVTDSRAGTDSRGGSSDGGSGSGGAGSSAGTKGSGAKESGSGAKDSSSGAKDSGSGAKDSSSGAKESGTPTGGGD
jgi:putative FmdB family regulatory protein